MLAWLAHGRIPLVAAGPFGREIAAQRPGAIRPYDDGAGLGRLVAEALADPVGTAGPVPDWPDTGAAHVALYRRLLAA